MRIRYLVLGFGLVALGGAGFLAAEDRFSTGIDNGATTEWRDSVQAGDADPQLGSPVGNSVGGSGTSTELSPATIQAISAEMPQGEPPQNSEVTYKQRVESWSGHNRRTVISHGKGGYVEGSYTEYRSCAKKTTYRDSYINGELTGSVVIDEKFTPGTWSRYIQPSGPHRGDCS